MGGILLKLIKFFLKATKRAPKKVPVSKFGRIKFVGLVNKRPLAELTHAEITKAFKQAGLKLAHNSHFIKRLVKRGPKRGINTLDDFARKLNRGVAKPGKDPGTIDIFLPSKARIVIQEKTGRLITFF